jgi:hypothetical protein
VKHFTGGKAIDVFSDVVGVFTKNKGGDKHQEG